MKNGILPQIRPSILSLARRRSTLPPEDRIFSPYQDDTNQPAPITLSSALQHYINSDTPRHGQKLHSRVIKVGFIPNTNISIKLLILHLKCGCIEYARQLFDELPQRTLSAYNYMIGGYLKQGNAEESLSLVRRLVLEGERVDGYTCSMIIKASSCGGDNVVLPRSLGRIAHAQILKLNINADDVLYTGLVDSHVKSGRVGYARTVFDEMLEKNVICSTSMISGYMNEGCVEEAKEIFDKTIEKDVVVFNAMIEGYSKSAETSRTALEVYVDMQRLNFRPNISTFASVIGACSSLAAFEVGQQVQGQIIKTEFFADIRIGSALVDMYSKCGRVEHARSIFDNMLVRNVFSWTSMIDGYGKNGYPAEALELFHKMQKVNGIEPNYVTFLSALSACGHAGLVDKGQEIFESMERDYLMKPRMEHYACMVDLLGRAGSLHKALEFVIGMPEKPNSDVWAALLSSCRLHGDVELANVAASELFKLNADDRPGAYVVLSNTLAAAGKWDSVTEVREIMKTKGISKDTARSCVGSESSV
ncbi:hypothetical protein HS088_TW09G00374 [Tripterygium wilfordii]|uniref:Pentatricopeptide repeat-containing protein n=1 Tax=Tripterygium wilfordii TaxID=458696 RepID=A0A7J7D7H7_TRIWF|nr:pentatricopeptide repeat-containing protein At1g28690, mitochondrial [Tripterygium wilfordii]KAF5742330.1 hypothetical protein HS088_TW09G00374 [Tripterygium wilfordii]